MRVDYLGVVKPQPLRDTGEGALAEQWGLAQLEACKPALIRLRQRSAQLPVPPVDSWLGRVDAKTEPFEASQQARVLAAVAADNLFEVNSSLTRRLPLFATYSMIRSAVEAASLALWILDAKSDDLAASRALRVYRQNIESDRTLWNTVVGKEGYHDGLARRAAQNHRRLRGVNHSAYEKAVLSTSVIQRIDARHPCENTGLDVFRGVDVWRLCSAVTHANLVSFVNILETRPDASGTGSHRTSRISVVAACYSSALHRANLVIDAFATRSTPRRGSA